MNKINLESQTPITVSTEQPKLINFDNVTLNDLWC